MRHAKGIVLLSVLVTLFPGCSNPAPPPIAPPPVETQPAAAPTPAKPADETAKSPAVSHTAPVAKAKKAVPADTPAAPAAAARNEAPKETVISTPPVVQPAVVVPPPTPVVVNTPPPPPPAPPEPTTRQVTIPVGTVVSVRMTDPVDSETAKVGQTFRATLDSSIAVDQETIAPKGADVYLRLTHVESAGNLTGKSQVALELDRILIGGKSYTAASNLYEKEAKSQTQQTAKHTGIGAAIGAAVGAIAGGGKGAAIGAGVGGGAGVAVEAATKGQQVRIESESRVEFLLQQPIEVTLNGKPSPASTSRDDSSPPQLRRK